MRAAVTLCLVLYAYTCHAAKRGENSTLTSFAVECNSQDGYVVDLSFFPNQTILFLCKCDRGYETDKAQSDLCKDVDECEESLDYCSSEANCVNTQGSFKCNCFSGYKSVGVRPGSKCADIDECTKNDTCILNTVQSNPCTNYNGSYQCNCVPGYENPVKADKTRDMTKCTDIDECEDPVTYPCRNDSVCTNEPGKYSCPCKPGYEDINGTCTNIDECSRANECDPNATCTDSPGSYKCECVGGYRDLSGNGTMCKEIDECSENSDICDKVRSTCVNTDGNYKCVCKTGYEHEGNSDKVCIDIDECEDVKPCDTYASCVNTNGSFSCSCFYGYTGNGTDCSEISPKLSELEAKLLNLSQTDVDLELTHAYYGKINLEREMERVRRLCALKNASLLSILEEKQRSKREVADFSKDSLLTKRLTLKTYLIENSRLELQLQVMKASCGLLD